MIERLSEATQVVNALAVVVLVALTAYYARKTKQILEESKKMRQAVEKQAAAQQQVSAATTAMLQHEREQVADFHDMGHTDSVGDSGVVVRCADSESWAHAVNARKIAPLKAVRENRKLCETGRKMVVSV